jgi:hypothetical protein
MAAIWKGTIAFGLVSIPIELHPAVREDRPRFRLLHASDKSPVHYERVCERDGKPVPWSDLVKGYEYAKGRYVVLTKDDFRAAAVEKTKRLDIIDFGRSTTATSTTRTTSCRPPAATAPTPCCAKRCVNPVASASARWCCATPSISPSSASSATRWSSP